MANNHHDDAQDAGAAAGNGSNAQAANAWEQVEGLPRFSPATVQRVNNLLTQINLQVAQLGSAEGPNRWVSAEEDLLLLLRQPQHRLTYAQIHEVSTHSCCLLFQLSFSLQLLLTSLR